MNETVDLVDQAAVRVRVLLDFLANAGVAGNVVVQFHRDSARVRKVVITHEEMWAVPSDSSEKR